MKQINFLLTLVLMASISLAQDVRTPKRVTIRIGVTDSIHRVEYGYLAAMADSGIVVVKSPIVFDHAITSSSTNVIRYENLSKVSVRRKGSVGRGILLGGITGMFVGAVTGYVTYKKPNCENAIVCWDFGPGTDAAAGATVGMVAGGIIGGIIGAVAKKTFVIGGNKEKFHQMKTSVLDMTYRGK